MVRKQLAKGNPKGPIERELKYKLLPWDGNSRARGKEWGRGDYWTRERARGEIQGRACPPPQDPQPVWHPAGEVPPSPHLACWCQTGWGPAARRQALPVYKNEWLRTSAGFHSSRKPRSRVQWWDQNFN